MPSATRPRSCRTIGSITTGRFAQREVGRVPFPAGVAAIQAKRIDGELFGEPFVSQARNAGLAITLMERNTSAPLWMVNGWIARRSWANANVDVVRRFSAAIVAANRWANAHVAETSRSSHSSRSCRRRRSRHDPAPWIESLRADIVQPVLDTCASYGVLTHTFPAKDIFYVAR